MCEEDTKIAEIFDKDIENFGKDLEKMIEHLNIVIATHNKQVEEIERLNNIINELEEYINEEWNVILKSHDNSFYEGYDTCIEEMKQDIINKIKELKGEII
jgi:dsDNA-specific endonuclease/ATPase MutS2